MVHGRYGHQAMEPADVVLIDAYQEMCVSGWRTVRQTALPVGYRAGLSLMVGLFKHEQSY